MCDTHHGAIIGPERKKRYRTLCAVHSNVSYYVMYMFYRKSFVYDGFFNKYMIVSVPNLDYRHTSTMHSKHR